MIKKISFDVFNFGSHYINNKIDDLVSSGQIEPFQMISWNTSRTNMKNKFIFERKKNLRICTGSKNSPLPSNNLIPKISHLIPT